MTTKENKPNLSLLPGNAGASLGENVINFRKTTTYRPQTLQEIKGLWFLYVGLMGATVAFLYYDVPIGAYSSGGLTVFMVICAIGTILRDRLVLDRDSITDRHFFGQKKIYWREIYSIEIISQVSGETMKIFFTEDFLKNNPYNRSFYILTSTRGLNVEMLAKTFWENVLVAKKSI